MTEDQQNNFIDETMSFIDSLKPSFKNLKFGRPTANDLEALLRLVHSTQGSANKLGFPELAKYCMKLEKLLLGIKKSDHQAGAAEVSIMIESEDIFKTNLKQLRFNKSAIFEATGHMSKLDLLVQKS